jgi:hypothetical protein
MAVVGACGRGGGKLEEAEVYTQYKGVTFVEKFKVWATGPDEVVARDAFYEPDNYVYDGSTVRLAALRGEAESFQLVVNADYGNINDVEVDVEALTGPGGAIPAENVSVYFEYYVTVHNAGDFRGRTGEVPDALVPLAEPFDLAKAQAQPLFVVVKVPADLAAGEYEGGIVIRAKGAATQKMKVVIKVLPETLEPAAGPPLFVEPDYAAVSRWAGGEGVDPVKDEELAPYLDLLVSRGIRPFDGGYSQRRLTTSGEKAAEAWAETAVGGDPTVFTLPPAADGLTPAPDALAEEYKTLYEAYGDKAPARPVVWADFPGGSRDPFEGGAAAVKWWKELASAVAAWPGKPALAVASSPFRGAPGVSMPGAVSYWVTDFGDVAACPERYQNIPGGNKYFLRADGSGGDVLDGRRAGARLLSWYGYLWGADGVVALAPAADAVRPVNPWLDDPMVGTEDAYGNGRGGWFYPGEPAGATGPVSSVRLELLREGREDWALFELVEKKRGRAYVEERLKALLPYNIELLSDISTGDLGNNQIFELRQALLEELAGAPGPGREVGVSGRVADAPGTPVYHARVGDGSFATYTGEDGSYRLTHRAGRGELTVTTSGFKGNVTGGGGVTLYRGLKGLLPVFDFEAGIDPAFWLSGDDKDAHLVTEERDVVFEGRIALGVKFAVGKTSRVVNLYPRLKDFSKHHRFEFTAYNPNDFLVDVWLLVLDDDVLDVEKQFRRRVTLRPRAWTRVSFQTKYLPASGEGRFTRKSDGTYSVKPGYEPDLSHIVGIGFEGDGLVGAGGAEGSASYKIIIDDVKLVIFD